VRRGGVATGGAATGKTKQRIKYMKLNNIYLGLILEAAIKVRMELSLAMIAYTKLMNQQHFYMENTRKVDE
jgi:hypothetical protein